MISDVTRAGPSGGGPGALSVMAFQKGALDARTLLERNVVLGCGDALHFLGP